MHFLHRIEAAPWVEFVMAFAVSGMELGTGDLRLL
jgi:hypothetical protein